jgi:hypothetical protein
MYMQDSTHGSLHCDDFDESYEIYEKMMGDCEEMQD